MQNCNTLRNLKRDYKIKDKRSSQRKYIVWKK